MDTAASLPVVQKSLTGMLLVFCFFALISGTLAELYVALVALPFSATTVLNDYLYEACFWTFRTILRLLYMRRVSAFMALLGELSLFVGLWQLGPLAPSDMGLKTLVILGGKR
jgi:hypothetical protein